jgi:hypothetical protein
MTKRKEKKTKETKRVIVEGTARERQKKAYPEGNIF